MIGLTSPRKETSQQLKHKVKQEYFNNLLISDDKRPKQVWKTLTLF